MADNPTDTLDAQDLPSASVAEEGDEPLDDLADFDDLPEEPELDEEEQLAKLQRGMADFEAGRCRPAKDVMREIAAEHGFPFEE